MDYFLRTTDRDGRSYGGFQWPMEIGATVTAPDWQAGNECGGGLHGLKDGLGSAALISWKPDALWWIVSASDAIDLGGKFKFQSCTIIAFGDRATITQQLYELRPGPIHGLTLTGGGNWSALAGGHRATLTGGNDSTLTGGIESTLTGGNWSALTGKYGSTLTGGAGSTLTGDDMSTLIGGYGSTLTGGDGSTLAGGDGATLIFLRWIKDRRRVLVAYVGENGVEPNVPYRANDDFTGVERVDSEVAMPDGEER